MTRRSPETHRRRPTQRVCRAFQGSKRANNPPWVPVFASAAMGVELIQSSYATAPSPGLELICIWEHLSSEGAASTLVVPIGDDDGYGICNAILRPRIRRAPDATLGRQPRSFPFALGSARFAETGPGGCTGPARSCPHHSSKADCVRMRVPQSSSAPPLLRHMLTSVNEQDRQGVMNGHWS